MAYIVIPTRHNAELVSAADTNQLMDNTEEIVNGTKAFTHLATNDTAIVTNLNADMLDSAHKSIDPLLATNSDDLIPTEKAVKTYVDNLASVIQALRYKGSIDCAGNPNYPAASTGYVYVVSLSSGDEGRIGGASGFDALSNITFQFPIGEWNTFISCNIYSNYNDNYIDVYWGLSSTNTNDGTGVILGLNSRTYGYTYAIHADVAMKKLSFTSKPGLHYLLVASDQTVALIYILGNGGGSAGTKIPTTIKAVCAYL